MRDDEPIVYLIGLSIAVGVMFLVCMGGPTLAAYINSFYEGLGSFLVLSFFFGILGFIAFKCD